jgi:dolichyl-phosphate-mannose--protein O-mannosyl transferase
MMLTGTFFQFVMYDYKAQPAAEGKSFSRPASDFSTTTIWTVVFILIGIFAASFVYFSPFVYGDHLTTEQITQHKWLKNWDFQWAVVE